MTEDQPAPRLVKRLRISGMLVGLGLAVEAFSLLWSHPTAFLAFMFLGATLVGAGVLVYLWSLASAPA
jgi:uncharacterized membrane protein YccC